MKVCPVCHRCFDDTVFSCIEHNVAELSSIRQGHLEMVSGYRLECMIERSGGGESYLAHHLKSDRECLIKIFTDNSDTRDQFLRDAETASSLFDPNIADIYETGSLENGDLYLVTEQLSGRPLREILVERGTIELLTTVTIIRQTAEAVHSLHLKGIIHRAIRPENIIVSNDNAVRLTNVDFGGLIEHSIVSDKFTIDAAADVLRYFAPEQFSGKESSIKADIYSLGIVFYEMLTGRPPFEADTAAALIEMHRTQRPNDVTIDDFDLRMLITHTLMESLNKHPENRQSSANAFARQLRHVEQLATHVSTPPPVVKMSVPVHTAAVVGKPLSAKIEQTPIVEPPAPQYVNTPAPSILHQAIADHAAPPSESRLVQFRHRIKRHRHEHAIDSVVQKESPIENPVPGPIADLPAIVSIDTPPQEIEVEIPIGAIPTPLESPEIVDEIMAPTEVPQPIVAPVARQPKDFVITNPRKLGLRDAFSTPPPKTSHHEPDEITPVTARPRPIRIPVEHQKTSDTAAAVVLFRSSVDSLFFPTLFGGSAAAVDERSSMFSGFHGEMADRNSIVPRVIKVGGLVIAIASLVLIGRQFTGELRSEAAPVTANSTRSISAPAQQPLAEAQNASQRISETISVNTPTTSEKLSPGPKTDKSSTDAELAKPRSSDETSSDVGATRSKLSSESSISKPAKADTAKTGSRSRPLARTAKADPKPQSSRRTNNNPVANKPVAQNKPGATTRPRIVANPRP